MIKDKIDDHQNIVVGVAIGVVVVMVTISYLLFSEIFLQVYFQFLNMMFSFAMCTMVK